MWAQGEMHTVTRDGSCVFTVPAGESCYSDALTLPVTMGEELEIRLYYASKVMDSNMIEENAVSYQGNHTTDRELPPPRREKYMEQYSLYAVSYTHLDVYKRQIPTNVPSWLSGRGFGP